MGLNVTGFSCAGTMWICAVSCREMMPDPAFFAECLRSSFEELKHAAARHAQAIEAVAEAAVAKPGKAHRAGGKRPVKRASTKAPVPARQRAAKPRRKAATAARD
jgi:hypothetical protein